MEHVMCNANLEQTTDPNPQSGAVEPVPVDPTEIEALEDDPTEELTPAFRSDPPTRTFRGYGGMDIVELLTCVGWVEAPKKSRELLEHYGIDLRCASYNKKSQRWNGCLFSVAVADLLEELAPKGEFPFRFEAKPALAEIIWWDFRSKGATERPELEASAFVTPGNTEGIENLDHRLRTRRGRPLEAR